MSIICAISLVVGIISLLYYGIIISYAGIGSSFSWFWLFIGVGCLLFFICLKYIIKNEIRIPNIVKTIFIITIIVGVSLFVMIEGTIIYYANKKADAGMEYVIVLGAQVRGTRVTRTLKKRLDEAALYLMENPSTIAIVSGGQGDGEDITEAEAMKRYLIEKGIKEDRIMKEEQSTNTNENILYSKKIIGNNNAKVAVITNGFHIYRAISIAKKQGINQIQGISAPSDQVLVISYYVREAAAIVKDKLVGNI